MGSGLVALNRGGDASRAIAAAPELSGTLSITWYHSLAYKQPETKRLYDQYMALNPKVKIVDDVEPTNDAPAWLQTRMMGGSMSDLYEADSVNLVLGVVPKKWFVALDPYLEQPNRYVSGNRRWRDLIQPPHLLDQGMYLDNKTYVFATEYADWAIFYNKDLFKKVGVTPPATWADLMAVSRKMADAGHPAFGLAGLRRAIQPFGTVVESMLWAGAFKHGPDDPYVMSPLDFCRAVKAGRYSKTAERTRQAWQLIKDFSQFWARGTLTATEFRAFTSGNTAMWYDNTGYAISMQKTVGKDFEVGIFPIPPITKPSSPLAIGDSHTGIGAMAGGHPIAIPTTTVSRGTLPLALDFLQFYTVADVVYPLAVAYGAVPAVVGARNLPPLVKQSYDEIIARQSLLGPVHFDLSPRLSRGEHDFLQGYLAGSLSLEAATAQLNQVCHEVADAALASVGLS
ncbi:MAG TPA: ABC transporter substrate-binding protein [bacterium]|nr:ABC transporter substrate-binding protein [bacterium]